MELNGGKNTTQTDIVSVVKRGRKQKPDFLAQLAAIKFFQNFKFKAAFINDRIIL